MAEVFERAFLFVSIVAAGLIVSDGSAVSKAYAQVPMIAEAPQDRMILDPTEAYYLVWNGPAVVDVGVPGQVPFARYSLAGLLRPGWTQLLGPGNQPLPINVQFDGRTPLVAWFTDSGTVPQPSQSGPTPADLQRLLDLNKALSDQRIRDVGSW